MLDVIGKRVIILSLYMDNQTDGELTSVDETYIKFIDSASGKEITARRNSVHIFPYSESIYQILKQLLKERRRNKDSLHDIIRKNAI